MVEHAERRAVRVALLPLQFLRQEIDGRVGLWLMIQLGSRGTGHLLRQDKNMSAKVHLSVSHQHPGWLKPLHKHKLATEGALGGDCTDIYMFTKYLHACLRKAPRPSGAYIP